MGRYKSEKLRFSVKFAAVPDDSRAKFRASLGWSFGLIAACGMAFMLASGVAQSVLARLL